MITSSTTPFWTSKTFWINFAALLSLIFPAVRDWLSSNSVEFGGALAALNIVIKFITHGQHSLVDDTPQSGQPGQVTPLSTTPYETSADGAGAKSGTASSGRLCDKYGNTRLQWLGLLGAGCLLTMGSLTSCGSSITYDREGGTITITAQDGSSTTLHRVTPTKDGQATVILPIGVYTESSSSDS